MSTGDERMPEQDATLTDLWQMVWRRKWVVAGAVVLGMGLALASGVWTEPVYEYKAVIELGTLPSDSDRHVPIESPENVVAKLNDDYIPRALAESKGGTQVQRFSMKASSPQKSDVVIIKGAGSAGAASAFDQVARLAVTALQQDHDRALAPYRGQLLLDIETARNARRSQEEQISYLQARVKRLDDRRVLLHEEIQELERLLQGLSGHPAPSEDAAASLTYLVLSSEIMDSRERLFELRQELHVGLADERDLLQSSLAGAVYSMEEQGVKIEMLQSRLAAMPKTQMVSQPLRSPHAKGPGLGTLLSLGLLGGLVAGICAVLIVGSVRRFSAGRG